MTDDEGVVSSSDGEELRGLASSSEGELGQKGSNKVGGGDDNGEELKGKTMSARRLLRNTDGGTIESSGGGDDRGEVMRCSRDGGMRRGLGVLNETLVDSIAVTHVSWVACAGNAQSVVVTESTSTRTSTSSSSSLASSGIEDVLRLFGGGPSSRSSASLSFSEVRS